MENPPQQPQPQPFQFQPFDLQNLTSNRFADIKRSLYTKRYRIERDYTVGEICRFRTDLPVDFAETGDTRLLDQDSFRKIIDTINGIYHEAEAPGFWNTMEAFMALITCHLSLCVCRTHYESKMTELDSFLDSQNKLVFEPSGFKLINPRYLANMYVELVDLHSIQEPAETKV